MNDDKNCSTCCYAKNDNNFDDKRYCIVKLKDVDADSCCGYYLKDYDDK